MTALILIIEPFARRILLVLISFLRSSSLFFFSVFKIKKQTTYDTGELQPLTHTKTRKHKLNKAKIRAELRKAAPITNPKPSQRQRGRTVAKNPVLSSCLVFNSISLKRLLRPSRIEFSKDLFFRALYFCKIIKLYSYISWSYGGSCY